MTSEQALRRIRQRIFAFPPEKEAQAEKVLCYLKRRVQRTQRIEKRGPYSGLTRQELHQTGTCEPDWF